MTSVYGVTRVGARQQIEARLKEKLHSDQNALISQESEKEIYAAAQYLAGLTLDSLAEMFKSAKEIMDWLGHCAKVLMFYVIM
jgi:DNA-directed RNA polymerase